jgi:CheY-like chemotaxis protein
MKPDEMKPDEINSPRAEGVILVVDDDDIVRETLCELLELHGHHAVGVRDGVEALAFLRSGNKVRFMVLDLAMPHMNGLQVLRILSEDSQLQELPLCISTAAVESAPIGVPVLPKPIDMTRLLTMIDQSRPN